MLDIKTITHLCTGGFGDFCIAVIGDYMLDHYIFGDVKRISPEAPVPVVKFNNEKFVAGGAGNVVANLAGLGVRTVSVGRVGDDDFGKKLLLTSPISSSEKQMMTVSGVTTVKTRIIGDGKQQIVRLDVEEIYKTDENEAERIVRTLDSFKVKLDCVIISDYGKGFCSPVLCRKIIDWANEKEIPVWIDPKKSNWEIYKNATLITPNLKELSEAYGKTVVNSDEEVSIAAFALKDKYKIENILVTRSEKGASIVGKCGIVHIPVKKRAEVYDVSGAGDTMLAAAAAFTCAGFSLADAAEAANCASQIAIGKVGTYAINAGELMKVLVPSESTSEKIFNVEHAAELSLKWKENGKKVIFTNGCFDILHSGHIDSLTTAKSFGDKLIVGLNSDASVKRLKGEKRPVNCENARAKLLSALKCVDAVVIFTEDTPAEILSRIRPDVIVKGGDYKPEDVAGREYAKEVIIVPLTEGFSTTSIIEKVQQK